MADLEPLKEAVLNGRRKEALELTQQAVANGLDPGEIIDDCLVVALNRVGDRFQRREIFVPEMMIAARTMQACVDLLKPLVARETDRTLGVVVLGTVFGDLHDIGKNLVKLLLEASGFRVVDLGENVPAAAFLEAARVHRADLVGLSSLLTTGDPYVEETIRAIRGSDIGSKVKIICGGAAMTPRFVNEKCGADAYARDAAEGVTTIKKLLNLPG